MLPRGLLKEYSQIIAIILRGLDVFAVMAAGLFAYWYKFGNLDLQNHYLLALIVAAVLTMVVFQSFQIYESVRAQSFWRHLFVLVQSVLSVLFLLAGFAFFTKTGELFSRSWFIIWALCACCFLGVFRCGLVMMLRLMRMRGWNERCVIIIGAGELGTKVAGNIQQAHWTGFRIVSIFDDHPEDKQAVINGFAVQKTPEDLEAYVKDEKIDEVWLALPLSAEKRVKDILYHLRHHPIAIRFVLDIFGMGLLKHSLTEVDGFPMLNLNSTPMVGLSRLLKALEDRFIAALVLILISPLLLIIAIGVKCTSKGPVLFKQRRHGWDGKVISVYKFRTMKLHEEQGAIVQATADDKRVTRFGRFLRKTSLDELPQFFNVLQGKMSIVGPRPHALSHNELYKDSIKAYMQRHRVKPGITGWAQVNGWRGETDTLEKMQKRIDFDLYYIENWSLIFDLKIILLTIFQGFIHKNAY